MKNKFYTLMWKLLRPFVLLLHPLDVQGRENLPDEPVLICANHSSGWDPVLLVCALASDFPLRIMAKEQLFKIPIIGGFIRRMGAFPVDRGNSDIGAVKTAISSLRDGWNLLIFPEGTRVKKPGQVMPKSGAGMMAIRAGVKMVPVFIGTAKRLFRKTVIIFGKPFMPTYTGRKGTAEEYQANTDEVMRRAYELGVSDYVSRPFDAGVVYRRVFNTIKLYAKQRRLISLVTSQIREKEKNTQMLISILSEAVEFRNGESGAHVLHIGTLTRHLLEQLTQKTDQYALTPEQQELIVMASSLHDIGKIAIDDAILNKPGRLTREEFDIMKRHTTIGAAMLDQLHRYRNEPLVRTAYEICRWHHERWDGRGYPDRLSGDQIPISAQVVAMADVYDALVSKRVYKDAYAPDVAVQMILHGDCGAFNPLLLDCLTDLQDTFKAELAAPEA